MDAHRLTHKDRQQCDSRRRCFLTTANDERECVAAARKGDPIAFEILYTKSVNMVFNVACRLMPTREDAEDVVQESFQRAFVHLKSFKGNSRFSTWVTRIATNSALMRLRKTRIRRELPLDESFEYQCRVSPFDIRDQHPDPEQIFVQKERRRMLAEALDELNLEMRSAIKLRELDERSTHEAACTLSLPLGTIKARLFRGRTKLREVLMRMDSKGICRRNSLGGRAAANSAFDSRNFSAVAE